MGGCSYDRDVYGSSSGWGGGSSSSGWGSSVADSVLSSRDLDKSMHPCNKILKGSTKHPIVIMLDVTGSNTDFAKIVYDKMPMFYGQIEQKGYLKDFEISVCAIGDAYSDEYPLQIADFAKGKDIDGWLSKLVLEGAGGGQRCETYELGAYYLLRNFEVNNGVEPIVFFLGDESPYDTVTLKHIREYIGSRLTEDSVMTTSNIFKALLDKIPNTYVFLNPYQGYINDKDISKKWKSLFTSCPEHIICMQQNNEKAIVDLMLGVIALINEKGLDDYKIDMLDRGQTNARIDSVDKMLKGLSTSLVPTATVNTIQKSTTTNRARNKNTRL